MVPQYKLCLELRSDSDRLELSIMVYPVHTKMQLSKNFSSFSIIKWIQSVQSCCSEYLYFIKVHSLYIYTIIVFEAAECHPTWIV